LGELGFESPWKKNFVSFIFEEIFVHGKLEHAKESATKYWIHTLRDDDELLQMQQALELYETNDLPNN